MITQDRLKEVLHYSPETGLFTWEERLNSFSFNGKHAGKSAGSYDEYGYQVIKIDSKSYKAHRLAFLYMEGTFPPKHVDHINRIEDDNRWENLRPATQSENMSNRKDNNRVIGVYFHKGSKMFHTTSTKDSGKLEHLGCFKEYWDAICARKAWESCNEV